MYVNKQIAPPPGSVLGLRRKFDRKAKIAKGVVFQSSGDECGRVEKILQGKGDGPFGN
jgi:hypothetical protein